MSTMLTLLFAIFFIVFVTIKFKIHPLFSLVIAALFTGVLLGFDAQQIFSTITEGFGKTLSSIGLIIAFGTTIGVFLEENGGTRKIADKILTKVKASRSPLAMNIVGFIISIPVFCDSGFIILSSLNKSLSKKTGIRLAVFAVALSTGLYAAHVFVPPTPGPLAAAALLNADLGMVMLFGLAVAIPVSLVGFVWASIAGKHIENNIDTQAEVTANHQADTNSDQTTTRQFILLLLPLLLPILLIGLKSIATYPTLPFGDGPIYKILLFIGEPIMALLLGVVLIFTTSSRVKIDQKNKWVVKALKASGSIILVTGAGGAFGNMIRAAQIESLLQFDQMHISGLLVAFLIAAALKTAQGSSTVAIITTAALIAPLLPNFGLESTIDKALSVLAIGAGALTVSHINDSYFWVVSQFSNLSVKQALKTHTLATLFQGITALVLLLLIELFFT